MSAGLIILIIALLVVVLVAALFIFGIPVSGRSGQAHSNLRSIVSAQRQADDEPHTARPKRELTDSEFDSQSSIKPADNRMTLRKRLKYAQWDNLPPFVFSLGQIVISLFAFLVVRNYFEIALQILSLFVGPIIMSSIINWRIQKRFKKFDHDYPQFLLSLVGLLKTGMNPMQALEASASGLEVGSVLKEEVMLMLERLRLGVSEEKSIGAFGEDINHPEIELFVQALLLSRRVGGTLSDTLDRLAKQVRKRQYFREAANSAVGLQRGSLWFILGILVFLECYLGWQWPESVLDTWKNPLGKKIAEGGICIMLVGIYWMRQVTKIRV